MFETNRREVVGKTLMDFAKILFGAHLASRFFAAENLLVRLALFLAFVVSFSVGWWFLPPKKGG